MVKDDVIRELMKQSVQGLEPEPTAVLADALLETDRPDLGEDLALVLSNRHPFPRDQRGRPFAHRSDRQRPLEVVFRRIHRRFAWSQYDEKEWQRGLRELDEIEKDWKASSAQEREGDIANAANWLEEDLNIAYRSGTSGESGTLRERTTWLLDGTFGRGAQILAEEIVDALPSRHNREAQLFRLVLAFDDRLPFTATDRIWDRLSTPAKRHATMIIRQALLENGGEIHVATPRSSRSRRPR